MQKLDLPMPVDMFVDVQIGVGKPTELHAAAAPDAIPDVPLYVDIAYPQATAGMPFPDRMPAVIEVHGGGWHLASKAIFRGMLMPLLGYFYVSLDYRLSGQARWPAQIHDVKTAIRWLRANADHYHIDPDRIGLWGGSAGGHLVSLAALTPDLPELEGEGGWPGVSTRVQAVAAVNPPTDFLAADWQDWLTVPGGPAEMLFGGSLHNFPDQVRLASPITHARADAPPFLFIHGTADDVVPFSQSQKLHEALIAIGAQSTLIAHEGVDHALYGYSVINWEYMLAFFRKHLGR